MASQKCNGNAFFPPVPFAFRDIQNSSHSLVWPSKPHPPLWARACTSPVRQPVAAQQCGPCWDTAPRSSGGWQRSLSSSSGHWLKGRAPEGGGVSDVMGQTDLFTFRKVLVKHSTCISGYRRGEVNGWRLYWWGRGKPAREGNRTTLS